MSSEIFKDVLGQGQVVSWSSMTRTFLEANNTVSREGPCHYPWDLALRYIWRNVYWQRSALQV